MSSLKEALSEAIKKFEEENKKKITRLEKELKAYRESAIKRKQIHLVLNEKNKKLKEENEKLKKYKEYYDKWSPILSDIDGDEFDNLLSDYGWEALGDEDELVNICVVYEDDEVDYYIDPPRKVVLKDGRIVKRNDGQTIQDINGKNYQMPTQEQADHFGISLEEMIGLMKTTDCDFSD